MELYLSFERQNEITRAQYERSIEKMANTLIYLDNKQYEYLKSQLPLNNNGNHITLRLFDKEVIFMKNDEAFASGQQWTEEEIKTLKNRKAKMTQEEAIKSVREARHKSTDLDEAFVSKLETLGLIKFDEPEPELDEKISLKLNRSISTQKVNDVLNMIEHLGYNISKRK